MPQDNETKGLKKRRQELDALLRDPKATERQLSQAASAVQRQETEAKRRAGKAMKPLKKRRTMQETLRERSARLKELKK